jgi:membrane-associated protease RseP (regulator of RpoE activity)
MPTLQTFLDFIVAYKWTLLFYLAIVLVIVALRKKFEIHGPVALYRTKIGLAAMDRYAKKYGEWLRLFAFAGIGVAVVGFFYITFVIIKNVWDLLFVPKALAGVAPVIPGFPIPGLGIETPFIIGWLVLFTLITLHEFSHGVIARVFNLKVKSSGILFLGPIMGAFVEPDDKDLAKQPDYVQYGIMAAGPVSNIAGAFLVAWLLTLIITASAGFAMTEQGYKITNVYNASPAGLAGLKPTMIITQVNMERVGNAENLSIVLSHYRPGMNITVWANKTPIAVTAGENKDKPGVAYLGVQGITEIVPKDKSTFTIFLYHLLGILNDIKFWFFALSLGIGLINLYPIFMTDGAQMLRTFVLRLYKNKKVGMKVWIWINNIGLFLIVFIALFGLGRWLFFS